MTGIVALDAVVCSSTAHCKDTLRFIFYCFKQITLSISYSYHFAIQGYTALLLFQIWFLFLFFVSVIRVVPNRCVDASAGEASSNGTHYLTYSVSSIIMRLSGASFWA